MIRRIAPAKRTACRPEAQLSSKLDDEKAAASTVAATASSTTTSPAELEHFQGHNNVNNANDIITTTMTMTMTMSMSTIPGSHCGGFLAIAWW